MKHCLLFILFCCAALSTRAASNTDSVRQYYNKVLEAEYCCIHQDFKKAIGLYKQAFIYKSPFASDVYNNVLCAAGIKDYTILLDGCERLVKKGAPLAFFSQVLFADFRTSAGYEILKMRYNEWHDVYLKSTNQQLIEYLRKLVALDQNVHCALPVRHEDTAFVNSMHNNDDSLAIILADLMRKNHCLDEDIIGAVFEDDTVLKQWPLYGVIALHQIQRSGDIITDILYEAMEQGQLRSEVGLGWLSQTMKAKLNLTRLYITFRDTLWKHREPPEMAEAFKRFTGQTDEVRYAILKRLYLNNTYFDVEERLVYNFYSKCKEDCAFDVYKLFRIDPAVWVNFEEDQKDNEDFMQQLRNGYDVLANK